MIRLLFVVIIVSLMATVSEAGSIDNVPGVDLRTVTEVTRTPGDRGLETQVDIPNPLGGVVNSGTLGNYAEVPVALAVPLGSSTPPVGTPNRTGQGPVPFLMYTTDGSPGFDGPNDAVNCAQDNPAADPTDPNDYACYVENMFDRAGHNYSIRGQRYGSLDAYYNPNTKKMVYDDVKIRFESIDVRRAMLLDNDGVAATEGRWLDSSVSSPRVWDHWITVNPDTNGALRVGMNTFDNINLPSYCVPGQDNCSTGTSFLVTSNDYKGANGRPKPTAAAGVNDSGAWGTCQGTTSPPTVQCRTDSDCTVGGDTCVGGWWRDKQTQAVPGIHPVMKISDFDARQCWADQGALNAYYDGAGWPPPTANQNIFGNTGKFSTSSPLNVGDLGTQRRTTGADGGVMNAHQRIATGSNQEFDTCIQRMVGPGGGFNLSVDRDGDEGSWGFMSGQASIATTTEDTLFNRLRYATPHNFRSGDGPFTATESCGAGDATGIWLAGVGSGLHYYVSVIDANTIELNMDYQTAVRGHQRVRSRGSASLGVCDATGGTSTYEGLVCRIGIDGDCNPGGESGNLCDGGEVGRGRSNLDMISSANSGVSGELWDYVDNISGEAGCGVSCTLAEYVGWGSTTTPPDYDTAAEAIAYTKGRSTALTSRTSYTCSNTTGSASTTNCDAHSDCQDGGNDQNAFCYMSPQLIDDTGCTVTLTKKGREIPITHPVAQGTGASSHGVVAWGDDSDEDFDSGDEVCAAQMMECNTIWVMGAGPTTAGCGIAQTSVDFIAFCF